MEIVSGRSQNALETQSRASFVISHKQSSCLGTHFSSRQVISGRSQNGRLNMGMWHRSPGWMRICELIQFPKFARSQVHVLHVGIRQGQLAVRTGCLPDHPFFLIKESKDWHKRNRSVFPSALPGTRNWMFRRCYPLSSAKFKISPAFCGNEQTNEQARCSTRRAPETRRFQNLFVIKETSGLRRNVKLQHLTLTAAPDFLLR